MTRILRTMAVGACAVLGACATMANPGSVRTQPAPDGDGNVKTARVYFRGARGDVLAVYDGGRQLVVLDGTRDRVRSIRFCREVGGPAMAATALGDAGSYALPAAVPGRDRSADPCEAVVYLPMVELDRSRPHTLRIVYGASEATVTVKASLHWGWFFANWVWMTFAPVGWVVDGVTGSWTYFGNVDLAEVLRDQTSRVAGR